MGAMTPLLDLGISEFLIKSCLCESFAQKLMHKPCQSCMASREVSNAEKMLFRQLADSITMIPEVYGCEDCSRRGCKGRMAIVFDDSIHADPFSENILRLLKDHAIMFEDFSPQLISDAKKFEHVSF
jgi:type II secretory ATPase GspE/PulE/Tfp pilus assembly ATPase PilB-like protein